MFQSREPIQPGGLPWAGVMGPPLVMHNVYAVEPLQLYKGTVRTFPCRISDILRITRVDDMKTIGCPRNPVKIAAQLWRAPATGTHRRIRLAVGCWLFRT